NTIKEHTIIESSKEIPLERVLYVTPNYIQSEGGLYDFNQLEEIKQLGKGEIALLLPKSLQNDASVYQAYFEDMVGKLLADGEGSISLHSNVYYISDEKRWFIYNHTPINYEQFL
ncbi:bacteriocin transporter, partial [Streptococcus suis]